MEIIVYDYGCQQSREVVAVIDYQKLSRDIEKRPEDYIFLLTPVEYAKYCELNQQIKAGAQGKPMNIDKEAYTKQYQGVFIIVELAIKRQFAKKYKVADMTKQFLVGDNHIVFYLNRADQPMERARQVLKRIIDLKTEAPRHTES